jgi:hypothetical protein
MRSGLRRIRNRAVLMDVGIGALHQMIFAELFVDI